MTYTTLFDEPGPRARRRHRIWEIITCVVVLVIGVLVILALSSHDVFSSSAWAPFSQLGLWRLLGAGLLNNLTAAVTAMILSMVVGCLLAFGLLAQSSLIRYFCMGYTSIFNSIPVLLLLFFTSLMLPSWGVQLPDFWFLVIALTLYSGAVVGDLIRAGVLALPKGQAEAATALGFSPVRTIWLILLPQALRSMSPAMVSQMVIIFKGTALAYVLGAYPELLHTATLIGSYYSQSALQALAIAAVIFMLINISLSLIAGSIERREQRRYGFEPTSIEVAQQAAMA